RAREVDPINLRAPFDKRPGESPLAAAQIEDTAAGQRFEGLSNGAHPHVIVGHGALEPALERVKAAGDLSLVEQRHDALLERIRSRYFQCRTATERPDMAQKTKPSRPSRKPCLPRKSLANVQTGRSAMSVWR